MSMLNSWSRKTVRPSFRLSWNQSRQVTRLPVQLWKYSWPTTDSIAVEVGVGRRRGVGQDELGVEDVEALVLHRAHVEVADRDDHEALEVERQAEARLVPHDRGDQRVHRVLGLVEVAAAHVDLEQVVLAGARADVLLARDQVGGDEREEVARLRETGRATSRSGGRCRARPARPGCRSRAAPDTAALLARSRTVYSAITSGRSRKYVMRRKPSASHCVKKPPLDV